MRFNFGRPVARAVMTGSAEAPMLRGTVTFYQQPDGALVVAEVSGLPRQNGFYGFHIHEGKSCKGQGFADTGSHYNPLMMSHPNHAGDLPPLLGNSGKAFLAVMADRFSISDVIGRTAVIHGGPDDFTSQPAGNSGMKVGCGVIVKV